MNRFLDRAKGIVNGVKDAAVDRAQLVAQAASDTGREASDRVLEVVDDVTGGMKAWIEKEKLQELPGTLDYLLSNDTALLLLADAIASAEAEATENTAWTEILKAALLDLKSTPAGGK
ncbi:hypothetical protein PXK56_18155 [Phaeobacter gallaeciensis]|uniref:hypothetical protein n=1 Tax=Phaeobacter gallaeciensis TaxID=60890 RepID=UPI0023808047|nr:hypothetical protein [Phaeobacter gallaeciensis]MDE4297114.1 hypothetical protein [Phaeobacter gallaeciensis]